MLVLHARRYRAHRGCQFIKIFYVRATDATRNEYVPRDGIHVLHPGEIRIIFFTYVDSEIERSFARGRRQRVRREACPREIVQRHVGVGFWEITGIEEDGFLDVATLLSEIQVVHHVLDVLGGYLVREPPYLVVGICRGKQRHHASRLQKENNAVEEPTNS